MFTIRNLLLTLVILLSLSLVVTFLYAVGIFHSQAERSSVASLALPTQFQKEQTEVLAPAAPAKKIKILFGGDLMFDRDIRRAAEKHSYNFILQDLQPLFQEHDLVVANLEGPITSAPSRSVGSVPGSSQNFIFTFSPAVTELLKASKMKVVNIGNNHILNFGSEGLQETKAALTQAGIQYFGNTDGSDEPEERTVTWKNGELTIGFVNYNQFASQAFPRALTDITTLRPKVDLVVVYTHWGNEYVPEANQVIQNIATELRSAGADVIIGSHPHVVQQRDGTTYYSLGNFVFDQYFEQAVQQGLLVSLEIDPDTLELNFTEYPIKLERNGQTKLLQPLP